MTMEKRREVSSGEQVRPNGTKSKRHNKRGNTALIGEFLIRWASAALVEGRERDASTATGILRKFFSPGTELYREYRLADSLVKATVSSPGIAASILSEAKRAARAHDVPRLTDEKFRLVSEISSKVKDPHFWDQPLPLYRIHAIVQTLINDWRRDPREIDLIRLAEYEETIVGWLQESKDSPRTLEELRGNVGEDRLLLRIMSRRLEEKYGTSLTSTQRTFMREYAFSRGEDRSSLVERVVALREGLIIVIDGYVRDRSSQDYEVRKLVELRESITSNDILNPSATMDDSFLMDVMDCARLRDELESKE
jgi:hypothetical protein